MDLVQSRNEYMKDNYGILDAAAKVCQDILLLKIVNSSLAQNVTIKGGVVLHNISNDKRRATQDFDFDFIKYSLEDSAIERFIEKLNNVDDGIKIRIVDQIEELEHEDYNGKRVFVALTDMKNNTIKTKLDIGVHKDFDISQEEYCFDLGNISQTATLLINSKEQIFAEKLKSLSKYAFASTRYKDFFDFYYLINNTNIDKDKLKYCINKFIFLDGKMREKNMRDVYDRLSLAFKNDDYRNGLKQVKYNWIGIDTAEGIESILKFIKSLE